MDYDFTEEEKRFRKEVEEFARKELPPDWNDKAYYWPACYGMTPISEAEFQPFCNQFLRKLGKKGWLSLGWPKEYGGMDSMMKQAIVDDVMSYNRAPNGNIATMIGGPTIIHCGSEEMKKEWLHRIASGEVSFFLGYSEPDAGSDLASLRTSAVEDGDEFIINGQKIWSTGAHISDYAWLIARTDQSVPQHKGISLMIVDCRSEGVTIQPLMNICGVHSFNEVFFDNVKVSKKNIVGEMNKGFYYLMVALEYERLIIGIGAFRRVLDELIHYVKETKYNGESLSKDPMVRIKLASMAIDIEVLYGMYWRIAWMMDRGQIPELEASVIKLVGTEKSRTFANAAMDILGLYGQLDKGSKWAPLNGTICLGYLDSISGAIGAGTSEIMRNVIATRGLGLPRE
ncbi:MAG: acyl-CoA dehydrogenase family protein [Thermodesulfobacteriota bacterium]|nr:acyl-CoA dehydrogenase family protein [Thermodesulfobacteriota bacterium]